MSCVLANDVIMLPKMANLGVYNTFQYRSIELCCGLPRTGLLISNIYLRHLSFEVTINNDNKLQINKKNSYDLYWTYCY